MILQPLIISFIIAFNVQFNASIKTGREKELTLVTQKLLQEQHCPTKLTTYLCWSKRNVVYFLKHLSDFVINVQSVNKTLLLYDLPEHQMFIVDLSCEGSLELIRLAARSNLFRHPFRWIIYGDSSVLSEFYLAVDSRVYVIELGSNSSALDIVMPYKQSKNMTQFIKTQLGLWHKDKGLVFYDSMNVARNRTNLNRTLIKISHVVTHPSSLNHLWDGRFKELDAVTKVNNVLMHHLVDYLNASKEFIMQSTWGYRNITTGIYSGLAGDLQKKVADLGGTPMFFTIDRMDFVDYIAVTTPTFMKFIFKAPPLSYVTNVFTLPFDTTVWHCSFVMVTIIGIFLYVIVRWEWKDIKFRNIIKDRNNALKSNIFDVVMMEIGAISQQGTDVEPKSVSGRIATIFTFLVLMFMYTAYSANIVALLQSTTDSIKTLEDLLNSRIKLGVDDIVYAHYYFETAKEPIKKAIYEQKVAPKGQKPNFMSIEEGIRRVQKGSFAFHVELANGYKVIGDIFQESEKCTLKEISYWNLIEPYVSVQKNSPYKKVMKVGLHKIHESGLQQRELDRIYTKKPVCHNRGSNFGSVGLIDCYSAFLIFGIGIGASIVLLVLEILLARYTKTKQSNRVFEFNKDDLSPEFNRNQLD